MSTKLVVVFMMLTVVSSTARAENLNLVDPPDKQPAKSGSVFNFFGSAKNYFSGSSEADEPEKAGDQGCNPIINAAGNTVRRRGCP